MEQLKQLRISRKITQQAIADFLGISRPTYTRYETGERAPDYAILIKLANYFDVSIDYILGREQPDNWLSRNTIPYKSLVQIPIVGRVAAGQGCYAQEDVEGYEPVLASLLSPGENYIFLRVQGDSMAPKILEGDLVLIQCQTSVDSGSYAVVTIDDEDGVVKKVDYGSDWIELISENHYYPARKFEGQEVLRIRVMGLVKKIVREM